MGMKRYFNGIQCKRGSIEERLTSTSNCLCNDCRRKKNTQNNRYHHSTKGEEWYIEARLNYRISRREEKSRYDREYREKNRDRLILQSIDWARRNPDKRRSIALGYKARRLRQERGGISSKDLAAWISSQEKICFWCDVDCSEGFHVDHVYPLSRGGEHVSSNLVISCPTCNIRKNAKDPEKFIEEILS